MSLTIQKAQYIVNETLNLGFGPVSPMKLQKLLYYVHAWSLVNDAVLVDGAFEKWKHGPVHPAVWHHFNQAGYVGAQAAIPAAGVPNNLFSNAEHKLLVDFITTSYAPFHALSLSAMTHAEDPWLKTPDNEPISADLIKAYYSTQPFAKNFPVDLAGKPYYPVEGESTHAFVLDMTKDEADMYQVYASFLEYKSYLEQARGEGKSSWLSGLLT